MSYRHVAHVRVCSGEHFFKKIELRASSSRRIALQLFVQLVGLLDHEVMGLAVKLRKELQERSLEDHRVSNGLSKRGVCFLCFYPRHRDMGFCANQKGNFSLSESPAATQWTYI